MGRDDLYITVPSFFRCPISLDVMKSPVSLCTGVTYDRASIQRWLDDGNNTCPATMQVLKTKELVPNRNLQRLIQIWFDSVARHQPYTFSEPKSVVVPSQNQVKLLVKHLNNNWFSSLSKILHFAKESEQNREFLARIDWFFNKVIYFMRNEEFDFKIVEKVVKLLDLMSNNISDKKPLLETNCLSTILLVLQRGNSDSQIQAVRLLESVAADEESKLKMAQKEGLIPELVKSLMKENNPRLIEATLACLIAITIPKSIKIKLIQHRTIPELKNLLSQPNTTISITEKSLELQEALSTCKEERAAEIWRDSVLLQRVVEKVMKVSSNATEHAVAILWSGCYLFRERKAREAVAGGGGNGMMMTKLLLLIQSNCSPAVRLMSADLLKLFRVSSKLCLSSYDTKTTHIMPF
ncbi:WD repeat-containing protein 44-like isoform X1 [Hibiscus syriacus]|uniref:U-box domain-containing protein n=1 Tax=Hibiscus syriacus TaxID=106335 RepID=A0A6A2XVG8_HIBSY|nr:U-box domain-containing protein 27-like [Hibiscus syriacus]KAE8673950.1 WD repeat-containing protein 44-like isoform X1 [Hibiscus syriacus]